MLQNRISEAQPHLRLALLHRLQDTEAQAIHVVVAFKKPWVSWLWRMHIQRLSGRVIDLGVWGSGGGRAVYVENNRDLKH